MVFITHVRLSATGRLHEHITDVHWQNPANGQAGASTVAQMVEWLRLPHAVAKVSNGNRTVEVGIVEAKPPHIRTYADGIWSDNLLALPRF